MNNAIYLKANRTEEWAIDNLHIWMKIAISLGYDAYIVCDNEILYNKIENLEFVEHITIINSIIEKETEDIVKKITIPRWNNAAYAHLTTFIHASKNGYDWFWNIDADDTMFCLPVDRTVYLLKQVEEYAINKGIDCFSLDMWYSKLLGLDWSFGITFTDNQKDWLEIIKKNCFTYQTDEISHGNIDNYFYFLRSIGAARIETWYFENLRFIHFSVDMMRRCVQSGVYYWKEGTLYSPIADMFGDLDDISRFPIVSDTVKLDIGITNEETKKTMLYYSKDGHARNRFPYIPWVGVEGDNIVLIRQKRFNTERFGKEDVEYVLFGAGWYLGYHLEFLKKYNDIYFVADNDSNKHGSFFYGLKCISPYEIKKNGNVVVIIMIREDSVVQEIANQLKGMCIKNIHYKDWERAVFSDNMFI